MQVKRENGRVWIDGLDGFGSCERASSVHGCQGKVAEAVGEAISYEDLICLSAFAFRVNMHEQMCPSSGHPCCGYMCIEGSNRANPWRVRLYDSFPWSPPKEDRAAFEAEARAAVVASIDAGRPVQYGGEEDGLIIGYGDEGRRWWCLHPYHKEGSEPFWHDEASDFAGGKWPWCLAVWDEPILLDQRPDEGELIVAALNQAVDMWTTEKREAYFCGAAAYDRWLGWLGDVIAGEIDDPRAGVQGSSWNFCVLVQCRRIAASWLRAKADAFRPAVAKHLRQAADCYAQLVDACMRDITCTWDLAPIPAGFDDWTEDQQQELRNRLQIARDLDARAVAAIERALAAMG